ncbi:ubiquitin carboxyl-terminal hydrolase [Aspergillus crustosus]
MTERVKRRKLDDSAEAVGKKADFYHPASEDDRKSWNGFCELESDPALFNVMLREFGVTGVKVQDVYALDDDFFASLPKPVYGVIFLFRWHEDDPDKQEASCPDGLWFANQTASNACATVALLNIVNNIEGADLGENLRNFKEFTMPFTPALRGDAINNFEFVKRIHNSFSRKMDILNSDLQLKHEAQSKRNRSKKRGREENVADAGFHFIAFVPVLGKVWKFDGLERQPQALGTLEPGMDWLDLAMPNIRSRMAEAETEISIQSLVRDPLPGLVKQLAMNIRHLASVEKAIASQEQGTTGIDPLPENTLREPDDSYGVTEKSVQEAAGHVEIGDCLGRSVDELVQHRKRVSMEQIDLKMAIREEQQLRQEDDEKAARRRYDYGPAIRTWLRFLAHKRVIEDLIPIAKEFR